MYRVARTVTFLVAAFAVAGCGRSTGDFGRAEPNVIDDTVSPFVGKMVARHGRGELVSDFNDTDREGTLHDRAWALVRAPHTRDWLGESLVEGQRTRILPELDARFDPAGYYAFLRRDSFRSSEARWQRLIVDMRADTELIGPFWADARRVREDDRIRLGAADGRRDLAPEELRNAYARIDENARVVDWVWRSMRFRLKAYRMAIDRIVVETPSDRLYEANRAWAALQAAIVAAESDFPASEHRNAPPGSRSRYSTGAGIQDKVPLK